MDKKELLEMALKLANHCKECETCECCPLEIDDYDCLFNVFERHSIEELIETLNEKLDGMKPDPDADVKPVVGEGHCPDEKSAYDLAKEYIADNVNHPKHYETGKFECIDVMIETQGVEAVQNFCICNAFKYIYRHKYKNACEDIRKAIWYLNKFVELEGGKI